MKLCINCKHYKAVNFLFFGDINVCMKIAESKQSPVDGKLSIRKTANECSAEMARGEEGLCRIDAQMFEPM